MEQTRDLCRADLHEIFEMMEAEDIEDFVDAWFNAETQLAVRTVIAQFKKKS